MLPEVGPSVARSGGPIRKAIGVAALRILRWRIEGNIADHPRYVAIVAPHTSNWDFVVGLAARYALRLDASWLGKHTLFRPPFGWIMRRWGGIAVDRTASHDVVSQTVAENAIVHMTVAATRTPAGPLSYQWRRDGTAIPFANLPTLTMGPVTLADSGAVFDCLICAPGRALTSAGATLTVIMDNIPPTMVSASGSAMKYAVRLTAMRGDRPAPSVAAI